MLDVADLIPELLIAPHLKILATSREPLRLYGEREIEVHPLPIRDTHPTRSSEIGPASRLFVERAQAVRPGFDLTDENAICIAEICQRLDGLPLAIELAAARIKLLTPQELLARLNSRLALLVGGPRDLPQRQQTLRHTLDWSYELLSEEEKRAFRHLGCLIGTWDIAAASACIASDLDDIATLDMLSSLVDKSLVRPVTSTIEGTRFMLLETIHEYAATHLQQSGEERDCELRHAIHYLQQARKADMHLHGAGQQVWVKRLDEDAPNLLLALRRALQRQDATMALQLGDTLSDYLLLRHTRQNDLERLLALDWQEGNTELQACRARVLYSAGCLALLRGEIALSWQRLEASRDLARQCKMGSTLALSLGMLAILEMQRGAYSDARSLIEEGLRHLKGEENQWRKAALHRMYGNIATRQGDLETAQTHYSLSLMLLRESGGKRELADLYISQATIMHLRGKLRTALYLYRHGLASFEELADLQGQVRCLTGMGAAHAAQGLYHEAEQYLQQALTLAQQLGDREGRASALRELGLIHLYQSEGQGKHFTIITTSLKESLRLSSELKQLPGKAHTLLALGDVERWRGNRQAANGYYEESLELARRMNDNLTRTRVLCAQAMLAHKAEDFPRACNHLKEGVQLAWRIGNHIAIATELESMAYLCLHTQQPELATQLLGSADNLRDTLQTPLHPMQRTEYQHLHDALRAEISPATWNENWHMGRSLLLAQVVDLVTHITIPPTQGTEPQSITPLTENPFRLTARECEVLRLLALGYPDMRIASELVLSRRTVNTHLRSIYAKLGVSTRTTAARLAFEHKLT
ncbi:tetratricopeptide repeat protein [Ktedonospora formicarum]|uniref:tetratricopeptide repeat protein n=1 Tax=Ktedonospora formicarum TaxID=2778364 RepID=UPI001C68D28B|nr:tetratricopeptide repeat protein [Ktedonospora formicarum]